MAFPLEGGRAQQHPDALARAEQEGVPTTVAPATVGFDAGGLQRALGLRPADPLRFVPACRPAVVLDRGCAPPALARASRVTSARIPVANRKTLRPSIRISAWPRPSGPGSPGAT